MPTINLSERAAQPSADCSTSYPLQFARVQPGHVWHVTDLSFRDKTSSPSRVDVYKLGHGYNHYLWQEAPAVANDIYTCEREFWVAEGETLVVEFFGGGATDDVESWATGQEEVCVSNGQ